MALGLTKSELLAMGTLVAVVAGGLVARDLKSSAKSGDVEQAGAATLGDPPAGWKTLAEIEAKPGGEGSAEARVVDAGALAKAYEPQGARASAGEGGSAVAGNVSNNEARIDLNAADQAALERLPGIGPARAEAILRAREAMGGFRAVEDLLEVPGIGEKTLAKLRPMVTLGSAGDSGMGSGTASGGRKAAPAPPPAAPPASAQRAQAASEAAADAEDPADDAEAWTRPVNINTADSEELQKIPGIGPALAERILERRKKLGPFNRPEDLVQIKGIGPKTFAKMRPWVTVR